MEKLKEYVMNQTEDKIYISELLSKILTDLISKCEENPDKYKKELEIMADLDIADVTGLPISQIEKLRINY